MTKRSLEIRKLDTERDLGMICRVIVEVITQGELVEKGERDKLCRISLLSHLRSGNEIKLLETP